MNLQGKLRALVRESESVLAQDPACVEARIARGAAQVLLRRPADALADLTRAAAERPLPETYFWLSEAYLRLRRPAQGLDAVAAGLRLRGDFLAGHLLRAMCRLELKQSGWEESWRHVLERAPKRLIKAAGKGAPREQMRRMLEAMGADRSLPAPWTPQGESRVRPVLDFRDPIGLAAAALGPAQPAAKSPFTPGVYAGRDNGLPS